MMIVVDVETTGLVPGVHAVASIGAIEMGSTLQRFYAECRVTDRAIDDEALAVNGFTRRQLTRRDRRPIAEALKLFLDWAAGLGDGVFAGHHPEFDAGFLQAEAKLANLAWAFGRRLVDLHSVCFAHHLAEGMPLPLDEHGHSTLNLDAILATVGLPPEPKPHHALTGAMLEAEALSRLIYFRSLLPEYVHHRLPA
jgi:DNA polymerase III epsilon subunit-like protein